MRGIAALIISIMIRAWKITDTSLREISFGDTSSLDAITRQIPEGYYSTFRTYDGCRRVLGLAAHLRRLYEPVSSPEANVTSLRRYLHALLEPYRTDEARVRIVMTKEGETYVAAEPLKLLPREVYEKGVRAETTDIRRETPRLKSTAFISVSDEERKHIAQQGIFEALLVKDGKILEGMTSNFFYVMSNRAERTLSERRETKWQSKRAEEEVVLCTARDDILLGVTRKTVIEVARSRGMQVKYLPLQQDQIESIDEAFLTSSSRGIVPIIQIDDKVIGTGKPGTITKELMAGYEAYVMERAEPI